ncbi:MAG: hypothetical protein HKN33_15060 [Pyrinomonadaceae bacterium]|nr:hypothetical protein [Pyrinomonadaceae bacterium]
MKRLILFALITVVVFTASSMVQAQRRDHLTDEEIELVRDVQEVDKRMEIFVKAIERRLWVIEGKEKLTEEQLKRIEKDDDKWGPLPEGTKVQLLSDIEKILNEAIDKLEDVYDREPKNALVPYALYVIADYSESLIPKLQALAENNEDIRELGLLESAANHCQNILEARANVPRPTKKRPKKKRTR